MNSQHYINLAKRAVHNTSLLASLISIHIKAENSTWENTAKDLELTQEQFARLALCNRPRDDQFMADIERISTFTGVDRFSLIRFVRRTHAIEMMQSSQSNEWLLAARDHDTDSDDV